MRNRHYVDWIEFLRQSEGWSPDQNADYQLKELRRIVRHAHEHTAGYRRLFDAAGISPDDIKSLEDIRKLPLVDKGVIRDELEDYSVNIIGSMIKAVNVPEEFEEKPRILVLLCENDAFPALDLVGKHRLQYNPFVRVIPVRCLGSVNVIWITEAISAGYDGVILIGCKYGDDYQCHFIKGSELADTRGENMREKLLQMSMENERVQLHQLQISDYEKLPEIFNNFVEVIEKYGMNPFKGM